MTETTDDKLLQQFFSDNRKEIEDNGFSRRVMHHLPNRYYRISQLWSLFCFTPVSYTHLTLPTICSV